MYQQLRDLLDKYELIPELVDIGKRTLREIAAKETIDRNDIQSSQTSAIKAKQDQLGTLLEMATRGLVMADEYEIKSKKLRKELKQLQQKQQETGNKVRNWYEIMGNTLSNLENANKEFTDGNMADKRRILLALGSNPIMTDGKLSINEHFWLRPIVKNKVSITEMLDQVRTASQHSKIAAMSGIFTEWYNILTEVRNLLLSV